MSEHEHGQHEKSDANIRAVVRFGIGVVILIAVAAGAMLLLFRFLETRPEPQVSALAQKREMPPTPRLQVTTGGDLQSMRAGEAKALTSYGWVDKDTGVVRIPIDRAMTILVEKGFPAPAPAAAPPKTLQPKQESKE